MDTQTITRTIYQAMGKSSEDCLRWLRKGCLKRTIEGLIMAAQEQTIRTNNIKTKIVRTQENSKCRMCGNPEEIVNHVLSECNKHYKSIKTTWSIKDDMIGLE